MFSSTRWANPAKSASVTGRPWHAFRTPETIFSREKASITPLRLMTERLAVSSVDHLPEQSGHSRLRRTDNPSSDVRESMTRVSVNRQKGQNIVLPLESGGYRVAVGG